MMKRSVLAAPGFNLSEVIVALVFIGIVSAIILPSVLTNTGNSRGLMQSKNIASEIQKAGLTYKNNNPGVPPVTAVTLADMTKYTIKETSGTINSAGDVCSAAAPCYRYPDGGVLIPETPDAWGVPGADVATFRYDPDGLDLLPTVVLRYDYDNERVATQDAFDSTTGNDPPYVEPWTRI